MKLTDLPPIDPSEPVTEAALEVSDEHLAMVAKVEPGDPEYDKKINDLKRLSRINPRLFNKIVSFD